MKETETLKVCLQFLQWKGVYCWRQNAGGIPLPDGGFRSFNGKKGLPDIWIIHPPHGTLIACEVKRPGGKMSEDQELFHSELIKLGGISLCVSSVEELEADLRELKII